MKKIISANNEQIKNLKKLNEKKFRDKTNNFLVENIRIIHDSILAGFYPEALFITENLVNCDEERVRYILKSCENVILIDQKINKVFSSCATPPGICATYKKPERKVDFNQVVVYLNGVSDPGNLGSIIRAALAFGIKNIIFDENCADIYNPKTVSAAKDAIFKINFDFDKRLKIFKKIKSTTEVYSTSLQGDGNIKKLKGENFCVVFGNEANGVSRDILDLSDGLIKINMSDEMESLNVAIAAGIVFYEIFNG